MLERFLGILCDNLDQLDHGIDDKFGGEALEVVVCVVNAHVYHEVTTIVLCLLTFNLTRTYREMNMYFKEV